MKNKEIKKYNWLINYIREEMETGRDLLGEDNNFYTP